MRRALAVAAAAMLIAGAPARAGAAEAAAPRPEPARGEEAARREAPGERAAPAADGAALQPYAAVRALQALQDQVARGSSAAQAAQPALLKHIADVVASAGPEAWKDARNVEAAALFLFSAGRPSAVRTAIEGATLTPGGERLIRGALAYAEGDDDAARALLGRIDPRTLPHALGGHLALVLASLFADKDPRRAGEMLDLARLTVPGTLVEEAALRRQVFLLAEPATIDRFASLSRQYLRRFRTSLYVGNFKARLTAFATRLATTADIAQFGRLEPLLADLPVPEARALYLSLARDALVRGRTDVARYAAARAAALSPDPNEAARARLYAAAAGAASEAAPAARAALRAIDPAALGPEDRLLRDAALGIAAAVDAVVADRAGEPAAEGAPADPGALGILDRGGKAIAASDAMIGTTP